MYDKIFCKMTELILDKIVVIWILEIAAIAIFFVYGVMSDNGFRAYGQ